MSDHYLTMKADIKNLMTEIQDSIVGKIILL